MGASQILFKHQGRVYALDIMLPITHNEHTGYTNTGLIHRLVVPLLSLRDSLADQRVSRARACLRY